MLFSCGFRDELTSKITGEDRRELMELQYQVGRLELENMELEQHRIVHESIVKGKDLVIQKLRYDLFYPMLRTAFLHDSAVLHSTVTNQLTN